MTEILPFLIPLVIAEFILLLITLKHILNLMEIELCGLSYLLLV